jgi:hypothetical protein
MTLRQALGGDSLQLHVLLEELLDQEDAVICLFDGVRAINFSGGFGLSPSQHELIGFEIERVLRAASATHTPGRKGRRQRSQESPRAGSTSRVRERLGGGFATRPTLRLVGTTGAAPSA